MSIGILILYAGIMFVGFKKGKKEFRRFSRIISSDYRIKNFKRWVLESFLFFGLGSLVLLFLLGEISALAQTPEFISEIRNQLFTWDFIKDINFNSEYWQLLIFGIPLAFVLSSIVYSIIEVKKKNKFPPLHNDSDDLDALVPRNFKERIWGAIISANAGFSEELLFRVLLPIAVFNITKSAVLAILLATILFGVSHNYQGIKGILITFSLGLVIFLAYIISGTIWVPIFLHFLIDFNSLVINSWIKEKFEKKPLLNSLEE